MGKYLNEWVSLLITLSLKFSDKYISMVEMLNQVAPTRGSPVVGRPRSGTRQLNLK